MTATLPEMQASGLAGKVTTKVGTNLSFVSPYK
eukprot:SAG25_NODE_14604_length_253_cov_0.649351_1_plen_32_part_10